MFTRKSLFVALTVIAMLAMLVPAAMAAPELVTGVTITSPVAGGPVWVKSPGSFVVGYTIQVQGPQVTPVVVTFDLLNQEHPPMAVATHTITLPVGSLQPGANAKTFTFVVPAGLPEGWYHLRVCINDGYDPYCTTQPNAVRIDNTGPTVVLERPVNNDACTWVSGNQYELFGYATDNFAVAHAWFEYTTDTTTNAPYKIVNRMPAPYPGSDVAHPEYAAEVTGFPGEFTALWNSSEVPDTTPGGPGFIRFVAVDAAGNVTPSPWVDICIENRVKVNLEKGWNLISTPLLLYQPAVADVLANVWCPAGNASCIDQGGWRYPANATPIDKIFAFHKGATPSEWTWWAPTGPDGVNTIKDGDGYWVHTVAPAQIEFIGTWLSIGPQTPPEYPVSAGWNLIGYTHWGTPTDYAWNGAFCPTGAPCYGKLVSEYLGFPMMVSVESMYRYDAARGLYVMVDEITGEQRMLQGSGYWLALAEGTEGTINP